MKKINKLCLLLIPVLIFTGCAAGSATAGYALNAHSADGLSAAAEQRIVERTKKEIMAELNRPCHACSSTNK